MSEEEIKAAAFYNIIEFTNWPREAFVARDTPFVIGILGQGPVASLVATMVQNETWRGRPIVVEHYAAVSEINACQALFIGRSARQYWAEVREQIAHRPVLCVGDGDGFAAQGGNVQLAINRNKLHILINLAATRANRLQLSSNLLHLSTIVGPVPESSDAPPDTMRLVPAIAIELALVVVC